MLMVFILLSILFLVLVALVISTILRTSRNPVATQEDGDSRLENKS